MSKNIFTPCSHIQKNTHNPNPIFKITIYCTEYTKNAKQLSGFKKVKIQKKKKKNNGNLFCNIYNLHNSYFVILVYFFFVCTFS